METTDPEPDLPQRQEKDSLRRYTDEDVRRFLAEDKIDEDTAQRIRALLRRGEL